MNLGTRERTPHPDPLPFGRGEGEASPARVAVRMVHGKGKGIFLTAGILNRKVTEVTEICFPVSDGFPPERRARSPELRSLREQELSGELTRPTYQMANEWDISG